MFARLPADSKVVRLASGREGQLVSEIPYWDDGRGFNVALQRDYINIASLHWVMLDTPEDKKKGTNIAPKGLEGF